MLAHLEVRAGVGVAVTDRRDGVSAGPWTSLNLADHVGDDADHVVENRRRALAVVATAGQARSLSFMRQVHGAHVAVVDDAAEEPPTADALVTALPGVALAVLVADCAPVLLWDSQAGCVGAVHVGRRGLAAGVVPAALSAMRALGSEPDQMQALVGPTVCPEHYEVPAKMRDEIAFVVPAAHARTSSGSAALDIRSGVLHQLQMAGVREATALPRCTAESDDLFSYRRDGTTGRFAGLVWLEP